MVDVHTRKQRSYNMSRIKGRDTKPELILRKELWRLGYRYRIKNSLKGKPDLVFHSKKVAIFIDGCFWHKCPDHYKAPKSNMEFWDDKISANVIRDKEVTEMLESEGWTVIRIWEHQVKQELRATLDILSKALSSSRY